MLSFLSLTLCVLFSLYSHFHSFLLPCFEVIFNSIWMCSVLEQLVGHDFRNDERQAVCVWPDHARYAILAPQETHPIKMPVTATIYPCQHLTYSKRSPSAQEMRNIITQCVRAANAYTARNVHMLQGYSNSPAWSSMVAS